MGEETDYKFILKYNDLYIIQKYSTKERRWKDIAAYTTENMANTKLEEIKKKEAKRHKDPKYVDRYKIKFRRKTGSA